MKKLIFAAISLLAVFAWTSSIANKMESTLPTKGLMYVQTAAAADITAIPNQSNTYKLTLKTVNPYVTYFADSPSRVTGMLPTEDFVNFWAPGKHNFSETAPNASLVAYSKTLVNNKHMIQSAIRLTHPEYDAKTQTLTYIFHCLPGKENVRLPDLAKYTQVALFVDPCITCTF